MLCPHCGSDVGDTGICERCGAVDETIPLTGWRPDPTARHEGRYYLTGRPTNRVRNGKKQATDPGGGKLLPGYLEVPWPTRASVRSAWLGTGVATGVIVIAAVVIWGLLLPSRHKPPSPEASYLSALRDADLTGQFNSDANAVAHAHLVCRQLDDGDPQQGLAADKLAVDAFCPQFAEGFHVLETATASGAFVLIDTSADTEYGSISSDGAVCEGKNGYADIGHNTQVTVTNGKGEILATTQLGEGHKGEGTCTFSFTFPVTEGQDRYVVAVGHRGQFSYTFAQLQGRAIEIHLGQ